MRKLLLLLSFVVASFCVNAQSTANYTYSTGATGSLSADMNSNPVNLSTGSTILVGSGQDDTQSGLANIGFDFYFMGVRYYQFSVADNGVIRLGGTTVSTTQYTIGTAAFPLIGAFANDMRTGIDGAVRMKVVGTAPNRCLVVEWYNNMIRFATSSPGTGTFQARLYETTGAIEYVYGTMTTNSATPAVYNIGISSSNLVNTIYSVNTTDYTASTSATVTTNSYTASSTITALNSASDGTRRFFRFVPPVPTAPSGLNFTSVGFSGMTLNWTDNSSNELGFPIYRSDDGGTTYNYVNTVAANGVTSIQSSLASNTSYMWKVCAVSEGGLSNVGGTQATSTGAYSGTISVGPTGTFPSLTQAFTNIGAAGVAGNVILELQTAYVSSVETFPLVISTLGSPSNTITVRPETGASNLSITSNNATGTVSLTGATYLTFDGRPGGSGSPLNLTIENTATAGFALRFINDARYNNVKYCNLRSVATSTTGGTVLFSTTTGITAQSGNSYNTISNNSIFEASTFPANAITSIGTATYINIGNAITNNNIYNFFAAAVSSNGILVSSNSSDWTITGNSFYQTGTRTTTAGANQIAINFATGVNHNISNNYIGGTAASCGGTAWTMNGAFANRFTGISLAVVGLSTTVSGNTIANLDITTATSAATANGSFCGISITAGIATISNNTIGSGTGTGSILVTNSVTGGSANLISNTSSAGVTISGNTIGSITATGTTVSISHGIIGILNTGAAVIFNNNTIGSTSTANSVNAINASTNSTAQSVLGISSSNALTVNITNNTIANLNNNYAFVGTVGIMRGISVTAGFHTITGNTVRNLSSSAPNTGTTTAASVIGIQHSATTAGFAGTTLITGQNTVHSLSNSAASAAVNLFGIYYGCMTTALTVNVLESNVVHSLSVSSSSTSATIEGIRLASGLYTCRNNMVRIGFDAAGTPITNGYLMVGLNDLAATANSSIIHNSVYVGGAGVTTGASNTIAFSTATTTSARIFRNNIFANDKTNAGGTGFHLAAQFGGTLPSPAGLTASHNVYYASTSTILIRSTTAAVNYNLAGWQGASSVDAGSTQATMGQINFINPTGTSTTGDLHIQSPTVIEASGNATSTTTLDYDGQTRASFGPVDIGADAGNFTALDIAAPIISYTALGNAGTLTNRTTSSFATITDVSGVNTTAGTKPRLYYKRSTDGNVYNDNTSGSDGWKYVEAIGATSPFDFTINYALLNGGSGVTYGNTVQYFVVAQDLAGTPNVAINLGTFALTPTDVNLTSAAFPIGGTPNSYSLSSPLSGPYTVGITGTYLTLKDFFDAINAGVVGGNITAQVVGDCAETATASLNQWGEEPPNSNYTITIQPTGGALRTISGSVAGALVKLNGADRVTIDGLNTGGNALTISNTSTSASAAIWLSSLGVGQGATNNTIQNCTISGGSGSVTGIYAIILGGATLGSAGDDNDNVTIQNNTILKATYGIVAVGNATVSTGAVDGLVIANNTVGPVADGTDNIWNYGIFVGNTISASINNNTVQNVKYTSTTSLVGAAIVANTGASNTAIYQNTVKNISQTAANSAIVGVYVVGTGTTVLRNTITSIYNTIATGYAAFGVYVNTGSASSNVTIANNAISDLTSYADPDLTFQFSPVGIYLFGTTGGINIYNNSVNLFGDHPGLTGATVFADMYVGTAVTALDVRNNIFANTYGNTTTVTEKSYAIYSTAPASSFTSMDNNLFYVGGTGTPVLASIAAVDRATMPAVRTGFGNNALSTSGDPSFTTTTNLLPTTGNDLVGTNIGAVTTDILSTSRLNPPTMGAYEVSLPGIWSSTAATPVWETNTNWRDGAAPGAGITVYIPSSSTNMPTLASSPILKRVLNNGTLTVSGTNTITASGDVYNNGSISGTAASLILNGTAAQAVALTGNIGVKDFTLGNAAGATLSGTGKLNVTGIVSFGNVNSSTLTTGGRLVLKSSAAGTARIADVTNTTTNTGNSVTGGTTVERYIAGGKRGFRFLAHPFNAAMALTQLADDIDITGNGSDAASPGFTPTPPLNNPSAFSYNPVTGDGSPTNDIGWVPYTTAAGTVPVGTGFRILIRGTKGQTGTLTGANPSPNPVTLSDSGTISNTAANVTKTLTYTVAMPSYNLVGNPYASQVNLKTVTPGLGVNNNYWIWNVHQGSKGGYITYAFGVNDYSLPSSASFVGQAIAAAANTYDFHEVDKTATDTSTMLRNNGTKRNILEMSVTSNNIFYDRYMLQLDSKGSANNDARWDAAKMQNAEVNLYSLSKDNKKLAIDVRPFEEGAIIPLGFTNDVARTYTLSFPIYELEDNVEMYLHDKYLQTFTKLKEGTTYPFSTTSDAASYGDNRFELTMKQAPVLVPIAASFSVKLSPNPATDIVKVSFSNEEKAFTTITIVNAEGKTVRTVDAGNVESGTVSINVKGLAKGSYYVTLNNGKERKTEKLQVQ